MREVSTRSRMDSAPLKAFVFLPGLLGSSTLITVRSAKGAGVGVIAGAGVGSAIAFGKTTGIRVERQLCAIIPPAHCIAVESCKW